MVTGAGGYIGTTLVPLLLEAGHEVVAIDRYFFGRDLLAPHEHLTIIETDARRMEADMFSGVDAVVDLVAISNDPSGERFQAATWQINCDARIQAARMAKEAGVPRYLLPSSCSIYGFVGPDVTVSEMSEINPLTTYAHANRAAEEGTLALADDDFVVTVVRQATLYGLSPRMRFDVAVNGMTIGAARTGRLPLMRDGTQWRPMLHVRDAARGQMLMLEAAAGDVNGEIFNLGSNDQNVQLAPLGERVAGALTNDVQIEWYGDPDHRSYQVDFSKIAALGYAPVSTIEDAVHEIEAAYRAGSVDRTPETITLDWYERIGAFTDDG